MYSPHYRGNTNEKVSHIKNRLNLVHISKVLITKCQFNTIKKKKRLFSREVLFLFLIIIILTYSNIEGVENFHLKRIFIEDSKYFRTKLKKKTHIY